MPSSKAPLQSEGRLIIVAKGGSWPTWVIPYRKLGVRDFVLAQRDAESDAGFRLRVAAVVREIALLGVTLEQVVVAAAVSESESIRAHALATLPRLAGGASIALALGSRMSVRDRQDAAKLRRNLLQDLAGVHATVEVCSADGRRSRQNESVQIVHL